MFTQPSVQKAAVNMEWIEPMLNGQKSSDQGDVPDVTEE